MKHKLQTPYCLEFVHRASLTKGAGQSLRVQEGVKNINAKDRTV